MEAVSWKAQQISRRIMAFVGGIDNVSGIVAGKENLLMLSVKHFEYVDRAQLIHAPFVKEIIFGTYSMTISLNGISAKELELSLKLLEDGDEYATGPFSDELSLSPQRLMSYLRHVFTPLLSALIAGGILQVFIVLFVSFEIFPQILNEELLFPTISGAVYYLLPILVAYSSAKYHVTNPYVAVCVAGILIQPMTATFITEVVLHRFLNFQLLSASYSNHLLPILIIVPIQAYFDRRLSVRLPAMIQPILKPFLLLLSGLLLGVFFFSPIMTLLGNVLVALLETLLRIQPWLVTTLVGAFGPILVTIGSHYSLFPLIYEVIQEQGYEIVLGPGLLVMNMAHAGVALAALVRSRKKMYRYYCGTAFIMALLGVSQPTIYGIEILLKRPLLFAMIGGGIGGLLAGMLNMRATELINPNIISLPVFSSIWVAIFCMTVSFAVAFLLTWFAAFSDPTDEEMLVAVSGVEQINAAP